MNAILVDAYDSFIYTIDHYLLIRRKLFVNPVQTEPFEKPRVNDIESHE